MRRAALALAAAAALVLAGAGPAAAVPYLEQADAEDLVEVLAEATAQQQVCYGWSVRVNDDSGGPDGTDEGSGAGVGQVVTQSGCSRWIELRGWVRWTSETSDLDDSSGYELVSAGLDRPPTTADLTELGFDVNLLVRDDGDTGLFQIMLALPRLVADSGEAPSVQVAPAASPPPAGSVPTGRPALPDGLRSRWPLVVLGAGLIVLAAVLLVVFRRSTPRRPTPRPRPVVPGPPPSQGAS